MDVAPDPRPAGNRRRDESGCCSSEQPDPRSRRAFRPSQRYGTRGGVRMGGGAGVYCQGPFAARGCGGGFSVCCCDRES